MRIEKIITGSTEALGLNAINILLGRNGAGKSRFLRSIDGTLTSQPAFKASYVSPERSGSFKADGGVLTNMSNNPSWLSGDRRKNQSTNFKAGSLQHLRESEMMYLRRLQDDLVMRQDYSKNFKVDCLDKINRILSNVTMVQEGAGFVFRTSEGEPVPPESISSGESEAVTLASEILHFFFNVDREKNNILLLDEPDVHLHPDLQARLGHFLLSMFGTLFSDVAHCVTVILSTHSSPFVAGLASSDLVSIGTKEFGVDKVNFAPAAGKVKKVFPFFGHPLSLSLSQDAMLILEGEDDERVWQQAARSSQGRIKLFPVLASSVSQQYELEMFCAPLLEALYDRPVAFSLRDGDGKGEPLNHLPPVFRYRMPCYAIENCLVTDCALSLLKLSWEDFVVSAKQWLVDNPGHKDAAMISQLISSEDRLRGTKIKDIRTLICTIAGTKKPWEVVVGQAIAKLDPANLDCNPFGLAEFIGREALIALLSERPDH